MNQQESDQILQQLHVNIESFFRQTLADDVQKIEYKPQFITQLLEMTPDRDQNESQEMTGWRDLDYQFRDDFIWQSQIRNLLEKVKNVVKEGGLDLSSDEDLSISIEEHLFFTANKTHKDKYYALLNEIREIMKTLLKEIIKDYDGEVWCISKHLLAASMRLMEVGTKALTKGEDEKAKGLFEQSYRLYMIFWEKKWLTLLTNRYWKGFIIRK